mmetsp:Transcript_36677/g.66938  ORF Transcript_36677/g.66938 Transcript_36677/m.66938 type:complete len:223 (+) Transcript_36677:208-876(+)
MLSHATAVKIEIIVQDAKAMKATKKNCHFQSFRITGSAIWIQLSVVVIWNNVKNVCPMLEKFWLTSSSASSFKMSVRTMEKMKLNKKSIVRNHATGASMPPNASAKTVSGLTILKTLASLSNRSILKKRSMLPCTTSPPGFSLIASSSPDLSSGEAKSGATHKSTIPKTTIVKSSKFHKWSLLKCDPRMNCKGPLCVIRSTSSTIKIQRKMLSNSVHKGNVG